MSETVYVKNNKKYVPIGRLYDRDHIGYGSYFVNNFKYGRALMWLPFSPNPDFLEFESAATECMEDIRLALRNKLTETTNDRELMYTVINSIRETYLKKRMEMLSIIKQ